jgi:hypothetical protein
MNARQSRTDRGSAQSTIFWIFFHSGRCSLVSQTTPTMLIHDIPIRSHSCTLKSSDQISTHQRRILGIAQGAPRRLVESLVSIKVIVSRFRSLDPKIIDKRAYCIAPSSGSSITLGRFASSVSPYLTSRSMHPSNET